MSIAATVGTADYLARFGMMVDQVVGKISDAHGVNAVQLIESGQIAFVINTPQGQGRGARTDGEQIRKAANSNRVSSMTTVEAALAAVQGLAEQARDHLSVRSLQEYHAR
jgi:carbamoyl-phosphate synthase large subunit